MTRQLGRASLLGGALGWVLLAAALAVGGLDPEPDRVPLLRGVVTTALGVALAALGLAIAALARGPQRVAAAAGLALSLLFLLYFTGFGFALGALFG
jgi:hypothetical protein